jgi:hypothetical protein
MQSNKQKILLVLLACIILLIAFFWFYWQQKKAVEILPARPPINNQLQALGEQEPAEPSTVFIISGQVVSVSADLSQLKIVTTRGEKIVLLSPTTSYKRQTDSGRPVAPPPIQVNRNTPPQQTNDASATDLQVGQLVKIESLTNISGLSTFTANKLTIID